MDADNPERIPPDVSVCSIDPRDKSTPRAPTTSRSLPSLYLDLALLLLAVKQGVELLSSAMHVAYVTLGPVRLTDHKGVADPGGAVQDRSN